MTTTFTASQGLLLMIPNLYKIAAHSVTAFHQVKTGDNLVYCQFGEPTGQPSGIECPGSGVMGYQASDADTTTGYNLVTGLGSVDLNQLALAWESSLSPNFTIAVTATPSSTLIGTNVTWNGKLTAVSGYTNTVTLSCGTGAPSTCTITPSTLVPTIAGAAFTVTVGSNTAGTYNFNIQGTDGTITNTLAVTLTVNQNFNITQPSLTPPLPANPGQTTTTTMLVSPVGSSTFAGTVTFTCSAGLPTGSTCSFSPAQIASGASATTVTVTVQTAGPFTGATGGIQRGHTTRKVIGQKQRLWLPIGLPLASIVLFGLSGRNLSRRYKVVGLCLMLALTVLLIACGGGSSSGPPPTTVTPATAQVQLGGTQQFTASNTATWSLSSGAPGTISTSGLYTAPTTGTTPASFTVTATPTTGSAGTASVTIPAVAVTVSPSTVTTLYPSLSGAPAQTQQFTATVANSTANQNVTWSVPAGQGTIVANSNGALYTAPATIPGSGITVTATSVADPSKSGTAAVTLQTPTPAGTSQVTVTATEGTLQKTTMFSLVVK